MVIDNNEEVIYKDIMSQSYVSCVSITGSFNQLFKGDSSLL